MKKTIFEEMGGTYIRHGIVSAVGHETDVTIADFVADLRSAEGMEVMKQELAEKITKLDEEIKQEPKIIKGGSVRKRRRRFLR